MNRDEILNMEAGRELDALVAEHVMKWKWEDGAGTGGPSSWEGATGEFCVEFEPSTDIAAAWEVVERVTAIPTTIREARRAANTKFAYQWEDAGVWAMAAQEAVLFICRAALLAVMEDDND